MPRKKRKRPASPDASPSTPPSPAPSNTAGAPAPKKFKYASPEDAAPGDPLTTREEQVVERVAKGLENLDIALELKVDERTIEKHMKYIRKKTGAKTRTGVGSWWYERKIEQLELRLREGK